MDINILNWSYQVRPKLTGLFFILIGLALIMSREDSLFQKIGFSAIFIGIFLIFIVTEKAIPKVLFDAQMLSNMELLHSIIKDQKLKGNGIYIPTGKNLSKERVFVPILENNNQYNFKLKDDTVFITEIEVGALSKDRSVILSNSNDTSPFKKTDVGVVFAPPGLEILESIEGEKGKTTKDLNIGELEKYLQIMIGGFEIIRDLSIKMDGEKNISVVITHLNYKDVCSKIYKDMGIICRQTGCPICSSILCALTRSLNKKIRIEDVKVKNELVEYKLKIGD
jgi:hypothetical protein